MIEFRFKAWNAEGEPKEGILTAGSREEARAVLQQSGLTINYVKRATEEDLKKHQRLETPLRKPPHNLIPLVGLLVLLVLLLVYQFKPGPDQVRVEESVKVNHGRVRPRTSQLLISGRVVLSPPQGSENRLSDTRIAVFFKGHGDEAVTMTGDIEWESDGSFRFTLPLKGPPPLMTVNLTYRHPQGETVRHRGLPLKPTRKGYQVTAPLADLRPGPRSRRGGKSRIQRDRIMRERLERSTRPTQKIH